MKIPKSLKVKTVGMPRWVWLASIIVMAGVLAYVRYRNAQEETAIDEDESMTEPETITDMGDGLGTYAGTGLGSFTGGPVSFLGGGGGVISGTQYIPPATPVKQDTTNVFITTGNGHGTPVAKPCGERPPGKPNKGFHYACVDGRWVQRGNVVKPRKPKPKKCGKRPKRAAGKGKKWDCRNGKWVPIPAKVKKTRGLFEDGPLMSMSPPPMKRDIHRRDRSGLRNQKELRRG